MDPVGMGLAIKLADEERSGRCLKKHDRLEKNFDKEY